jgi:hypothetical protein
LFARLSDRWAGRKDGKFGMPVVPEPLPAAPDPSLGVTPYLEIRNRHYLDRAARERRRMEIDVAPARQRLGELRRQIASADAKVTEIQKRLEGIPEVPDENVLSSRNVVEQHAHAALVRARRQREHSAERGKVVLEERRALDAARALRIEEGRLEESIIIRWRILDCRVRQLHQHTLRRCATYKRLLVQKHPDGPAVIPLLDLFMPALPEWIERGPPDVKPPLP